MPCGISQDPLHSKKYLRVEQEWELAHPHGMRKQPLSLESVRADAASGQQSE